MALIRPVIWRTYDNLEEGRLLREYDLSNEDLHPAMTREFLQAGDDAALDEWIAYWGVLWAGATKDMIRRVWVGTRFAWRKARLAIDNPLILEEQVAILVDPFFLPDRPLRRILKRRGTFDDRYTIEQDRTFDELFGLGRSNYRSIKSGANPLPDQYRELKDKFDAFGWRELDETPDPYSQIEKQMPFCKPELEFALFRWTDDPRGVDGPCGLCRLHSSPDTYPVRPGLMEEPAIVVQALGHMTLAAVISGGLRSVSPSVQVVVREGEVATVQEWAIKDPWGAICFELHKQMTRSGLWEVCPHPECGRIYRKARSDQASCDSYRCRKYVYRQKKRKGE